MRFSKVTPEGEYVPPPPANSKASFSTMTYVRATIVEDAGEYLARAVTIAVRHLLALHLFRHRREGTGLVWSDGLVFCFRVRLSDDLSADACVYRLRCGMLLYAGKPQRTPVRRSCR